MCMYLLQSKVAGVAFNFDASNALFWFQLVVLTILHQIISDRSERNKKTERLARESFSNNKRLA